MKHAFCLAWLLALPFLLWAQHPNNGYNKTLADSLGADDNGMRMYQFIILKTGPNPTTNKDSIQKAFGGHMQNITRLVKEGKLIVAGPFGKNDKQYRGLFILKAKNTDEAKTILLTDPAIKEGLLDFEIYNWYGSAALPMYLPYSETVSKTKF